MRRSCRPTSGVSARPASSAPDASRSALRRSHFPRRTTLRRKMRGLAPEREQHETDTAYGDAPPCEQREAMARDVIQKRLHNEIARDEGAGEADRNKDQIV